VKARRKRFTLDDARIELQASEEELAQALKEKHVLIIDGAYTWRVSLRIHDTKADG
jgi:Sister chromatid cohesion protein Dcc1